MQQFPPSISLNKDTIGQQGPACGPPKPPQTWQTTIVLTAENDDTLVVVDRLNSGGNWWRGQIEVGGDGYLLVLTNPLRQNKGSQII